MGGSYGWFSSFVSIMINHVFFLGMVFNVEDVKTKLADSIITSNS